MRPSALFERCWAEMAAGASLSEIAAREPSMPVHVEEELSVAAAIGELARTIEIPDAETEWMVLSSRLGDETAPAPVRRLKQRRRMVARYLVAATVGFVALGAVSAQALPGSPLYSFRRGLERTAVFLSPNDGSLHLRLADARLTDLLDVLRDGPVAQAPALAQALVSERRAAIAWGTDARELDERVAAEVPAALSNASPSLAAQVRAVLGSLLPPATSSQGTDEGVEDEGASGTSPEASEDEAGQEDGSSQGGSEEDEGSASSSDGVEDGSGDEETSTVQDSGDSLQGSDADDQSSDGGQQSSGEDDQSSDGGQQSSDQEEQASSTEG